MTPNAINNCGKINCVAEMLVPDKKASIAKMITHHALAVRLCNTPYQLPQQWMTVSPKFSYMAGCKTTTSVMTVVPKIPRFRIYTREL